MLQNDPAISENEFIISFDPENKLMHVDFSGDINLKGLIDSFSLIMRHEDFYIGMPACYDFTNASLDIDINSTEVLFHFIDGLNKKRGNEYQLAIVYSDGITRALVGIFRLFFSRTYIDVESFRQRVQAVQWIIDSRLPPSITYL